MRWKQCCPVGRETRPAPERPGFESRWRGRGGKRAKERERERERFGYFCNPFIYSETANWPAFRQPEPKRSWNVGFGEESNGHWFSVFVLATKAMWLSRSRNAACTRTTEVRAQVANTASDVDMVRAPYLRRGYANTLVSKAGTFQQAGVSASSWNNANTCVRMSVVLRGDCQSPAST